MSWPGAQTEELEVAMANVSNGATQTSRIDTRGYDYAIVRVLCDTWTNSNSAGVVCQLLHADDTVVTNFATIVANETHTPSATVSVLSYRTDLRGKKRWLRVVATPGATTNDLATLGMHYTLMRGGEAPANTTDMVVNSTDSAVIVA